MPVISYSYFERKKREVNTPDFLYSTSRGVPDMSSDRLLSSTSFDENGTGIQVSQFAPVSFPQHRQLSGRSEMTQESMERIISRIMELSAQEP